MPTNNYAKPKKKIMLSEKTNNSISNPIDNTYKSVP